MYGELCAKLLKVSKTVLKSMLKILCKKHNVIHLQNLSMLKSKILTGYKQLNNILMCISNQGVP